MDNLCNFDTNNKKLKWITIRECDGDDELGRPIMLEKNYCPVCKFGTWAYPRCCPVCNTQLID